MVTITRDGAKMKVQIENGPLNYNSKRVVNYKGMLTKE
jgi:hypothetical protein